MSLFKKYLKKKTTGKLGQFLYNSKSKADWVYLIKTSFDYFVNKVSEMSTGIN